MRFARRLIPASALALATLGACADEVHAPTALQSSATAAAAQGALRDGGINRGDTHFSATVVTTTEESVVGGEFGIAKVADDLVSMDDAVHLEGGYGSDGQLRFGVWFDEPSSSPKIGSMQLVGDNLSVYDQRGVLQEGALFDSFMASIGLPGGTMLGAYFPSEPPGYNPCLGDPDNCGIGAQSLPGATVSTEELGDLRIVRSVMEPSGVVALGGGDRVQMEHRYRRVRGGNDDRAAWRLEEIVREQRSLASGQERVTTVRSRVSYRNWHRNPARDATREREATARRSAQAAAQSAAKATAATAATAAASVIARDVTGEQADAIADLICRPSDYEIGTGTGVADGRWLLMQHGFCSNATTWTGFAPALAARTPITMMRAYSLTSTARIETQVAELRERLGELGGKSRPHLVVGHSAGGLVARRFGQLHPTYVEGVVTIGSPHLGSHVADFGPEAASDLLMGSLSAACFSGPICQLVVDIIAEHGAGRLTHGLITALAPVLVDLRTGSEFQAVLNSTTELFPRVSIAGHIDNRWELARMIGDSRSPRANVVKGRRPSGDALVTDVQRIYGGAQFLRVLSAFVLFQTYAQGGGISCSNPGYSSAWPACTTPNVLGYWTTPWYQEYLMLVLFDISGRVISLMNRLDATWAYLTTRGQGDSDGFIHAASQSYPKVPGPHPPLRITLTGTKADSHSGQTASPGVMSAMDEAIEYINTRALQ